MVSIYHSGSKNIFHKTFFILVMFCLLTTYEVNTSKVSKIIKYLKIGDFVSELKNGEFQWSSFIKFLENLPFDKESSTELIQNFTEPLFSLIDQNIDQISKIYMTVVDLKHGDGDGKKSLKINIKICILLRMIELGAHNASNLLPPESAKAIPFIGGNVLDKLPNSLLFIIYGVDQGYYVDYTKFPTVFQQEKVTLQKGFNLAQYANKISILSQQCGSCLAFSSAAVLTHFYYKYYLNLSKKLTESIFIEPYHLIACTNNSLQVEKKYLDAYTNLFPNSNGFWASHGCQGGMSPEMLFWAKYNTNKLGVIDIKQPLLNKMPLFNQAVKTNNIKLGQFCEEAGKNVLPLALPFPKFDIKLISRDVLRNKSKRDIAETLMSLINKYGFIFASLYYDPIKGKLFDCRVPEEKKESTQTYHYVALAGVEYIPENENYNVLIHNSWGGSEYYRASIYDNYIDCNLANALFVLESLN